MVKYFIYCRKSSEDEERQILSIRGPARRVKRICQAKQSFRGQRILRKQNRQRARPRSF